jgi:hypothetical protein
MILVDSRDWINHLNGNAKKYTDSLDTAFVNGNVVLGDLILLEILQGFKINKEYNQSKA